MNYIIHIPSLKKLNKFNQICKNSNKKSSIGGGHLAIKNKFCFRWGWSASHPGLGVAGFYCPCPAVGSGHPLPLTSVSPATIEHKPIFFFDQRWGQPYLTTLGCGG